MEKIYTFDGENISEDDIRKVFSENPDCGMAVVYTERTGGRELVNGRMTWIDLVQTKVVPFASRNPAFDYIGFLGSQTNRSISDIHIEVAD
jgi:hypothetical protein